METVSVEGRTLKDAILKACDELHVPEKRVKYKLDTAHFRDSFGRARGVDTVRILAWSEEVAEAVEVDSAPANTEAPVADDSGEPADYQGVISEFVAQTLAMTGLKCEISDRMEDQRLRLEVQVKEGGVNFEEHQLKQLCGATEYLARRLSAVERGKGPRISVQLSRADMEEKERNLKMVASKVAEQVIGRDKALTLKPMNSYERRIIHLAISRIKGVGSKSIGEGSRKRVQVFPMDQDDD